MKSQPEWASNRKRSRNRLRAPLRGRSKSSRLRSITGGEMAKYRLVVLTEPVEGREAEYNTWYNEKHLQDVVAVPGFGAAQRFRLKEICGGEFKQRYLAIYDIEADDYAAAVKEMLS